MRRSSRSLARTASRDRTSTTPSRRLAADSLGFAMARAAELVAVVLEGGNLTLANEALNRANPGWPTPVRGAVRDLAWTSLRAGSRGDLILNRFLRNPPATIVRALLLVAVQRLMQKPEQAHTVVDQAVDACAELMPPLKAMVNGVLRNALRQRDEWHVWIDDDEAARYAHPQWWIERVRRDWPTAWEAVLEAGNGRPPMAVRPNLRRTSTAECEAMLAAADVGCRTLANGALLLDEPRAVAELPGFAAGLLSVQDAGAQWAAHLLAARDGERVLDACAAPGGKAAHILERAAVELLALEIDPQRAQQIQRNLDRLGLEAKVEVADCTALPAWWDGRPFERILADVPCSASGVVRRHPDIKWLRREADVAGFAARQARILNLLWRTLAPGGTMLYVTCSVFDEENTWQLAAFERRHPDAERVLIDEAADRSLAPGPDNDGFYYALLRKRP